MDKNTTIIIIIILVIILLGFSFFVLRKNKKSSIVEDKSITQIPTEPVTTKNISIESKGNQAYAVLTGATDVLEAFGNLIASLKDKEQETQETLQNENEG